MTQADLIELFTAYAHQPWVVYGLIVTMLTASSFGLPIPEEVTLISAGIVGYIVAHPQTFVPAEGASGAVTPIGLAVVCFLAVFLSDFLVYGIGRWARSHVGQSRRFAGIIGSSLFARASDLIQKNGMIMVGVFRFTPGIRFPGHMSCGFMRVAAWKFILIDGLAALLTVPTQVLLVAYYGDVILDYIKQFKIILLIVLALLVFFWMIKRWMVSRPT